MIPRSGDQFLDRLDMDAPSCTCRVIGEVCQESDGQIVFRYLKNTPDFETACTVGFKGFPAFRLEDDEVPRCD